MSRLYDSVNPFAIPTWAPAVAGYGDGRFLWTSDGWARFPDRPALSIVVDAADVGDILDVERYDARPEQAPGWCRAFDRPRRRAPTVYCSRDTWPAARAATGDLVVDWFIATLDGTVDVPGAVAVQYVDTGPYDVSLVLDPWWLLGVWPPGPPAPTPPPMALPAGPRIVTW